MTTRKGIRSISIGVALLAMSAVLTMKSRADKPDWQKHIDWSIGNTGAPDCADQYVATEPKCLTEGNRSCLMRRAIDSAKHNNCDYAFRLTLITQCHNGGAQQQIGAAGKAAVCEYLNTK
jgi:hypothetical protein